MLQATLGLFLLSLIKVNMRSYSYFDSIEKRVDKIIWTLELSVEVILEARDCDEWGMTEHKCFQMTKWASGTSSSTEQGK